VLRKYRITRATEWRYDEPNCNMYDEEHKALFAAIRSWDANPPVMPMADGSYPIAVPGVTKLA